MPTRLELRRASGARGRGPGGSVLRRASAAVGALALLLAGVIGAAPLGAQEPSPTSGTEPRGGTTVPGPPGTVPAVVAEPPSPTPRDEAAAECLVGGRPVVDLDPVPPASYPPGEPTFDVATVFDARGSRFDNTELNRVGFGFGVRMRPAFPAGMCLVGGSIRTEIEPEDTPWDVWHRVAGIEVKAPGVTVVGTTLRNQGDLVTFIGAADDWSVVGVAADGRSGWPGAYIHDDCIENDSMLSGQIVDSKFDGCFSFLSATHASDREIDGSDDAVEVRGTLVRLQPYRNSFNVPKYGDNQHGGFFKWARTDSDVMIPPSLSITDSVFRADGAARFGGNENGFLGLPNGTRCERVLLIGTESWPADDLASWTDQCTDLSFGTVADWDAAVAAWDATHPPLRDLVGQGRDVASAALGW
jgi:hypothetical protein